MSLIYVDEKKYQVDSKKNLLQACLELGIDIPYFCWHPVLGSVGVCRQCAIKKYTDKNDKQGNIIMSCMTPALNNTYISINDIEAKKFRKSIIELLMIHHPHDCPVCEEGGQCHLQDMTVMNQHYNRRYRFKKRTHKNQYLGPFISHEMNRCISCYRCIRYYKDYADGKDFGVYGCHDNIYFGRYKEGMLNSEFSGNLIEICPTGVFTDKIASKKYTRKWDMQFSPSVCHYCSIGCNIIIGERNGELRKIENRYNSKINSYFICDLGRFGYEYANLENRPISPLKNINNVSTELDIKKALKIAVSLIKQSNKVIGIGSPRSSLESNFSLLQLVGKNNFSSGLLSCEKKCVKLIIKILESNIYNPTLQEIEQYDAILILGEDLTQTSSLAALSVRQAVKRKAYVVSNEIAESWNTNAIMNHGQGEKYPLFITSIDETKLDEISSWSYYGSVVEQARLGFAIANKIDSDAPNVSGLDEKLNKKISMIANKLLSAKKPLIISGMHLFSTSIIQSAFNIAIALKNKKSNVGISLFSNNPNNIGLGILGGQSLEEILDFTKLNKKCTAIILENDLYRKLPQKNVNEFFRNISQSIILDHINTKTLKKSNLLLPVNNFFNSCGTIINQEGRAQRFFQVCEPTWYNDQIKTLNSWSWLYAIYSNIKNKKTEWITFDNLVIHIIKKMPKLIFIKHIAPNANFKIHGQKIARSPNKYSGRTSILSHQNIHEKRQPQDKNSMFSFSMEGHHSNSQYIPFSWFPGWNSVQSWNKHQDEIGKKLRYGDPGIKILKINKNSKLKWFYNIPDDINYNKKQWLIVPYYHLFGSEEMTQLSPSIKKLSPKPYAIINDMDINYLNNYLNNKMIQFNYLDQKFCLPVRFSKKLKSGLIGLPIGLKGIPIFLSNKKLIFETG